jgi:hypothetical protein
MEMVQKNAYYTQSKRFAVISILESDGQKASESRIGNRLRLCARMYSVSGSVFGSKFTIRLVVEFPVAFREYM